MRLQRALHQQIRLFHCLPRGEVGGRENHTLPISPPAAQEFCHRLVPGLHPVASENLDLVKSRVI